MIYHTTLVSVFHEVIHICLLIHSQLCNTCLKNCLINFFERNYLSDFILLNQSLNISFSNSSMHNIICRQMVRKTPDKTVWTVYFFLTLPLLFHHFRLFHFTHLILTNRPKKYHWSVSILYVCSRFWILHWFFMIIT